MVDGKDGADHAGPLSIVLLCSSALPPVIGGLVSELSAKGLDVEVVKGAELDSEKALSSVRRYGRSSLYVFCRDDELDDYGVDHLKEVLRHSGRLEERHLVAITPRARSLSSDASALSTKARLLGRSIPASARKSAPPPPAPKEATADKSGFEDEEASTAVFSAPHSDRHPIVPPTEAILDTEEIDVEVDIEPLPDIGARRKKGVAAAIGSLALAGAAALFVQCGSADASEAESTAAAEAGPSAEAVVAQTQAKLAEEAKAKEEAAAAEAAEAEAEEKAADQAYRAEREAAAGAPVAEEKAAAMQEDETAPDEEVVEEVVEETPAEQETIDLALNQRKLRALDMLLIDPRRSGRGNFKKAWEYCNERDAYGVTGWRLPTVGEITTLVSTGMVTKDRYWTITDADTSGSRRLLYDGKRKRIKNYSPYYKGARAVCIRKRAPDEE